MWIPVGKTAAIGSFPDNGYGLYDAGKSYGMDLGQKESRTYDFDFKESAHGNVDHQIVGGDSIFTMIIKGWRWFLFLI